MTTPVRRQYLDVKRRFPNTIVLFRLGDFYETFDEDAKLIAKELEITLTSRPHGKDERVPLAGFPYHSLQTHLKRLVGRGFRVAICEQLEDPKSVKGIVPRDVTRVVTPGTVVEEELLSGSTNNYLAAVVNAEQTSRRANEQRAAADLSSAMAGLAFIDITTGEFAATVLPVADLAGELAQYETVSPTA